MESRTDLGEEAKAEQLAPLEEKHNAMSAALLEQSALGRLDRQRAHVDAGPDVEDFLDLRGRGRGLGGDAGGQCGQRQEREEPEQQVGHRKVRRWATMSRMSRSRSWPA